MKKSDFKLLVTQAVLQALSNLVFSGMLPISIYPKVHVMGQDEVSVDLVMEEDSDVFWVKITL
jgi:hypothetical protein